MDYQEAVAWLDAQVNLEALVTPGRTRTPSLEPVRELLGLLGDPHREFPIVHLTGTNGKTSTARMITRLLEVAGLSVGTYTSPDLEKINERMSLNGAPISDREFAEQVSAVAGVVPFMQLKPSRFDLLTAMAYRWFAEIAVHAAVVEVGLFGLWDSTNAADGQVAVITNVGFDHLDYLPTREEIAKEKVGIVKKGAILVLGETDEELAPIFAAAPAEEVWRRGEEFVVLENEIAVGGRLLTLRTPSALYDEVFLRLHGDFQGENAAIALAAAEAFLGEPLGHDLVVEAFGTVTSPGRVEVMGREPLCVLDGAHNPSGASALASTIEQEFDPPGTWTLVMGSLRPHDPAEFLDALSLPELRRVIACEPRSPRAVPAAEIAAAAAAAGYEAELAGSAADALGRALALSSQSDGVLVTGSLYVVGEARTALRRGVG